MFDYNNVNKALGKVATQSSDAVDGPLGNQASKAVDGSLSNWSHTNNEQGKSKVFSVYSAVVLFKNLLCLIAFLATTTDARHIPFFSKAPGGRLTWERMLEFPE